MVFDKILSLISDRVLRFMAPRIAFWADQLYVLSYSDGRFDLKPLSAEERPNYLVLVVAREHYFETVKNSLSLQWLSKDEAPQVLGKLIAVGSITSLILYGVIWSLLEIFKIDYVYIFLLCGVVCVGIAAYLQFTFPIFKPKNPQHKSIVLRKKYMLYYILIFLSGARRQIFVVFAAFLMVEKFKYSASEVTLLFLVNYLFNWVFAEKIGKIIHIIGEKKSLTFEYVGLIIVFISYGLVNNAYIAAFLYIVDHMFFALALAINTYFQKIADPKDIASSAGVSFTINHIAAIFVPVLLGFLWIYSNSLVFYIGALFALLSLIATQFIPSNLKDSKFLSLILTLYFV